MKWHYQLRPLAVVGSSFLKSTVNNFDSVIRCKFQCRHNVEQLNWLKTEIVKRGQKCRTRCWRDTLMTVGKIFFLMNYYREKTKMEKLKNENGVKKLKIKRENSLKRSISWILPSVMKKWTNGMATADKEINIFLNQCDLTTNTIAYKCSRSALDSLTIFYEFLVNQATGKQITTVRRTALKRIPQRYLTHGRDGNTMTL